MSETWIILGATSSIARCLVRDLAGEGAALILAGRDQADLDATAADCLARGASMATPVQFDVRDPATFGAILDLATGASGPICAAVFTGSMPDQEKIDADVALIDGVITDSFTGPARFLQELAPHLERKGEGTILGIGSVAGDRGRLGNYVYGSAKAGFATYLSGLRNRLGRSGVHVVTVKPGPVDTAMTWGLDGLPFMTTPDKAAAHMLKAARKGRNVVYTAPIWRIIMMVIRSVPEPIFKKMEI